MHFLAFQHEIALRSPINLQLVNTKCGSNDTSSSLFLAFINGTNWLCRTPITVEMDCITLPLDQVIILQCITSKATWSECCMSCYRAEEHVLLTDRREQSFVTERSVLFMLSVEALNFAGPKLYFDSHYISET